MTGQNSREDALMAARLLLARMDLTPEDLLTPIGSQRVPTFGDYIPVVLASMPANVATRENYGTYLQKVLDYGWADRPLDEPTVTEFQTMIEHFRATRSIRRSGRGGRAAVIHAISALRYLYRQAVNDRILDAIDDPAARLKKPPKMPSRRRAMPEQLLQWIIDIADTTGDDPELDSLIIRLHIETACRMQGGLSLRPEDLDPTQCVVHLREKGGKTRWQPVSPSLMNELRYHGSSRGAVRGEPLLRYRSGKPITERRYNYFFERVGQRIPTAQSHGITVHWIRHTTLRWVERNFGKAVAKAYGGHTDRFQSANDIYTTAGIEEVAEALADRRRRRWPR